MLALYEVCQGMQAGRVGAVCGWRGNTEKYRNMVCNVMGVALSVWCGILPQAVCIFFLAGYFTGYRETSV